MFSPLPWATPTPPLTSRSAPPHAQQAGADCTLTQTRHAHQSKLAPPPPEYLPRSCGVPVGRPHRDTLTVLRSPSKSIARKRNFVSAEVVYEKLHAVSITLEIWKRSARQIRVCWPLAALPDSVDPES